MKDEGLYHDYSRYADTFQAMATDRHSIGGDTVEDWFDESVNRQLAQANRERNAAEARSRPLRIQAAIASMEAAFQRPS